MRVLVKVTIPTEAGNKMLRKPDFPDLMKGILAALKPEAAYYMSLGGQRCCMFIANMESSSQIPAVAEPFWLAMGANVEIVPVMNQDDFNQAGASIAEAARKY